MTLLNGTLPRPAMFKVSPVLPAPIVTLCTVPFTYVGIAVPELTPSTLALRVYCPAGACEPSDWVPFHEKLAIPLDCAPRLTCCTSTPALFKTFTVTDEEVCGTATAPVMVAPFVGSVAVELATSAWCPSSEDACSAWLELREFESAVKDVLSCVMPWTSLSSDNCVRKVLLSTGLVGSWFCSCANIRVRKSVPPSVVPVVASPLLLDEVLELPPVALVAGVLVPVPAAECVLLICMISL